MKTKLRTALAMALTLILVFTLSACGPKEAAPTATPTAEPTQPVEDPVDLGIDFLPDNATDLAQKVLGFPDDTVLLTVNGTEVTAEEYLYWLGNMTSYYDAMMGMYGGSLNLDEAVDSDGTTWGGQLKESAYQNVLLIAVTPEAAAQYGITLDDEDMAELRQQRESNIENAGGEEEYARQLQGMGISDKTSFELDRVSALFAKLQEAYTQNLLTAGGADALTDEDMAAYLEETGTLRAKHILLLTKDPDTGEEYDDAKKAEQKAKAEDILAKLREDPTQFDTLMNENSEDSGLSSFPDGYLFGPNEMVTEFEEGTRALAVGEISDIVESTYGYHIILRLDADCDEARQECAEQKFNDMMNVFVNNAVVEKKPEYDSFTTKDYYSGLTAFQDTLLEPEVEDQSTATVEPQPTDEAQSAPTPDAD